MHTNNPKFYKTLSLLILSFSLILVFTPQTSFAALNGKGETTGGGGGNMFTNAWNTITSFVGNFLSGSGNNTGNGGLSTTGNYICGSNPCGPAEGAYYDANANGVYDAGDSTGGGGGGSSGGGGGGPVPTVESWCNVYGGSWTYYPGTRGDNYYYACVMPQTYYPPAPPSIPPVCKINGLDSLTIVKRSPVSVTFSWQNINNTVSASINHGIIIANNSTGPVSTDVSTFEAGTYDFFAYTGVNTYGGSWTVPLAQRASMVACTARLVITPLECSNGATNPTACNICPSDKAMNTSNQCVTCANGGCTNNKCNNGAINPPSCNTCGATYYLNPANLCVPNPCLPTIPPSNYNSTCSSGTNACGLSNSGTIQCNGTCSAASVSNNKCIVTFIPSTTSIPPNGSVDFTWTLLPLSPGITRTCGFVDRSKPDTQGQGTPIPGLQNLDPNTDSVRINNIQRNTEFCLVCTFRNAANALLPGGAVHQWVRVIRIGEV
jgi:hypothetical protein